MLSAIVGYIITIGPYFGISIFSAVALVLFISWARGRAQQWFFPLIFLLSIIPSGAGAGDGGGSFIRQLIWGGAIALAIGLLFQMGSLRIRRIDEQLPISLLFLMLFIAVSIAWSPYPVSSFKRFLQLLGVCAFALLAYRFAVQKNGLSVSLQPATALVVCIGLLFAVAFPGQAIDRDGALNGIAAHKNTWGQLSLLSAMVWMFNLSGLGFGDIKWNMRRQLVVWAMLIASVASLFLSKSATSYLAFLAAISLVVINLIVASRSIVAAISMYILLTIASVGAIWYTVVMGILPLEATLDLVFRITDKSSTLTGRHYLWELMMGEISLHPWLGTGYGGFWAGLDGASGALVRRLNWGPPSQAHSGYLDVVNEIGFVGAALLFAVLVIHAAKIWRVMSTDRKNALFHGAILIAALISNYAESSLLRTTHIWWIVLCASIAEIHYLARKSDSVRLNSISFVVSHERKVANAA